MPRPETHNDLANYQRDPIRLLSVPDMPRIATLPGATTALGGLLDILRAAGAKVGADGDVYIARPVAELDEKLEQAQRAWDSNQAIYRRWVDDGVFPPYEQATQIWAKAEGLPPMVKNPEPEHAPDPGIEVVVVEREDIGQ